jgi:hypothetical protein
LYLSNPSNLKKLLLSKPELMQQELQKTLKDIPVPQAYKDFLIEFVQLNAQEVVEEHMPDLQSTLQELIAQMRGLLPNAVRDGHIKSLAKHPAPETAIGRIPIIELVRSRSRGASDSWRYWVPIRDRWREEIQAV